MKPLLTVALVSILSVFTSSLHASDLAYKKEGNGPGVVFIHGLGGNRDAWAEISKRLKKDHTVLSVDLPGHGGSSAPPFKEGAVDLDAISSDLVKLIRKQKIEPVILVGHNIGGAIAVRAALGDPKIARGIILVDSSLAPVSKAIMDKLEKDLDVNASAALGEYFGAICKGEVQKAKLVKDALKVPIPVLKAYMRTLSGEAMVAQTGSLRIPVALFASTILSPDPAKEKESLKQLGLGGIPKFSVSYFVDAWHWIMWDDPDTFEILFNDFENNLATGGTGGGSAKLVRTF